MKTKSIIELTTLIVAAVIFTTSVAHAGKIFMTVTWGEPANEDIARETITKKNIRSEKIIKYYFSNGRISDAGVLHSQSEFDRFGNETMLIRYDCPLEDALSGRLKRQEEYIVLHFVNKYDAEGRVLRSEKFNRRGYPEYKMYREYDTAGNLISEDDYRMHDGDRPFDINDAKSYSWTRDRFKYENGRLIEETFTGNCCIDSQFFYDYGANGKLSKCMKRKINGPRELLTVTEYKYDSASRLIEERATNANGARTNLETYSYEGDFKTKVEYDYDPPGKLKRRTVEKYDSSENLIELAGYDSAGHLVYHSENEYDRTGSKLESRKYDADGNLTEKYVYTYYSPKLIDTKTIYRGDTEPVWMFKRNYATTVAGAGLNAPNLTGECALIQALNSSNFDSAELLIANSSEVEVVEEVFGKNALMISLDKKAPPRLISKMIERGANLKFSDRFFNNNMLTVAVSAKNPAEVIQMLIDAGAAIDLADINGNTPLMYACADPYATESVKLLLNAGADPDLKTASGQTARSIAFAMNNSAALDLINAKCLPQGDENAVMPEALMSVAIMRNDTAEILSLLRKGVSPNLIMPDGVAGGQNSTALLYSVKHSRYETAKLLLENGAALFVGRFGADDPLEAAVAAGDEKMVRIFLEHGRNFSMADSRVADIFRRSLYYGKLGIVKLFIDKGFDVNFRFDDGKTPLLVAAEADASTALVKLLIAFGSAIDAFEAAGDTALIIAARKRNIPNLLTLIEAGANVHIKNKSGVNALMETKLYMPGDNSYRTTPKESLAAALIKHGVKLDLSGRENNLKFLFHAVHACDVKLAEKIIASGVDIDGTDESGLTPLWQAAGINCADMVRLLVAKGANVDFRAANRLNVLGHAIYSRGVEYIFNDAGRKKVLILLAAGARIDAENAKQIIGLAYHEINFEIIKIMLAKGISVDTADENGMTLLLNYCYYDASIKIVRQLVKAGASIKVRTSGGMSPLLVAALNNSRELFDYFLSKGASIGERDNNGKGVVLSAVNGRLDLRFLKYILDKGADPDLYDDKGDIALIKVIENSRYRGDGSDTLAVELLAGKTANIGHKNKKGFCALSLAYEYGLSEIIVILKKYGARPDYNDRIFIDSMFAHAVRSGDTKEACLLIGKTANLNRNIDDGRVNYPLHIAIKRGDIVMTKLLVESGARVAISERYFKFDAVREAVEYKQLEILKYFISRGIRPGRDGLEQKALEEAVSGRDPDTAVVELLLNNGWNKDYADDDSNNLLQMALKSHNAGGGFIEYLLGKGVDVNHANKLCETPIFAALWTFSSQPDSLEFLLKSGADLNARNSDGETPIFIALRNFSSRPALLELLLKSGADPNVRNSAGETPLLKAALESNTVQVELLKKYGARVEHSDRELLAALFCCQARTGDPAGTAALLDMGVDPTADSVRGDLVLHKLIAMGRTDIIELLVSRGLEIKFDDKFYSCGFLPAIQAGHIGIVKYFVERGADIDYFISYDMTPIIQACANCRAEIAEYLIGRGVKYYYMPDLLLVAMKYHTPTARMAEILLDAGLDINYVDSQLQNALMIAIRPLNEDSRVRRRAVNADLVRLLIRRGIDINAADVNGSTALSRAKAKSLKDIVKILRNAGAKGHEKARGG